MLAEMRNPFIMATLKLGYCTGRDGMVMPRHHEFYGLRAGHAGAVTVEPLYLRPEYRELPTQLGIDDDNKIKGLSELAATIHRGGAKAVAHINHPGRQANPMIPGNRWVSSVAKACESGGAVPEVLDQNGMAEVLKLHEDAAVRAEKAGFDMIELQLGQGYLAAQFLSPAVNSRTDDFGGSFENRSRFPLQIFRTVKNAVSIPVIVRMTAMEFIPGGIDLDEAGEFGRLLKTEGAAALHVVTGSACSTPPWFFQHMFVPKGKNWELTAEIRKRTEMEVVTVGRITSAKDVSRVRDELKSDYIAVGRALVADPDFIGKVLGTVPGTVRPCLSCSEGCLGGVKSGKGLGCIVNPDLRPDGQKLEKSGTPKTVAVVGAGIAGLEAAVSLHRRGHHVELFERAQPGGQFNLAWLPPKKESLKDLTDFYLAELKEKNISVTQKDVVAEDLDSSDYDEIVVATGAVPLIPRITGLNSYEWADVLERDDLDRGGRTLVIGGGMIGIEVAVKLLSSGHEVIIVEMMDELARGMEMIEKKLSLKTIQEGNAQVLLKSRVVDFPDEQTASIERADGEIMKITGIDRIVVATGMKADRSLADSCKGGKPVHVIGDALNTSNIAHAIASARDCAAVI